MKKHKYTIICIILVIIPFILKYYNIIDYCDFWLIISCYISAAIFRLSDWLMDNVKIKTKPRFDGKQPTEELISYNGIGTFLLGNFRYDSRSGTYVAYIFFCLYVPFFPVGCWRIGNVTSMPRIDFGYKKKYTTTFKVYGSEKPYFLEILFIMLYGWSGVLAIFLFFCFIFVLIFD
ncbi:MAG: hypothetical protein IKH26_07235 [Bacteroidaceae bacterium]|nr:hypothetical protein [Bacteroidaceae bacterium]